MAFPVIATASNLDHRPAGFQAVYIRPSAELYQTLGAIKGGELMFTTDEVVDGVGKNKAYSWKFTAKCTMLQCSLVELELIDTICSGTSSFLFKLMDAGAIPVSTPAVTEGWVLLSSAQVGVKAKVVVGGTPDENLKIELEWSGSLLASEVDAAIKALIVDTTFEATGGTGTLKTIGTYTAALNGGLPRNAGILPCGVSTITLDEAGASSPQTVGKVSDFTMNFDWQTDDRESLRRFATYIIAMDVAFSWLATDHTNLLNLEQMPDTEINIVITLKNGLVFTLTNQVGIGISYEVVGDADKRKVVKFKHTGRILQTSFDSIVS